MKTMHLNMQRLCTDPGQVLDNLMKDVMNTVTIFPFSFTFTLPLFILDYLISLNTGHESFYL
jgi:hypothetical protein